MPGIREQLAFPGSITSNLIVTRALLKPGRAHQEAVDSFSPHDRVREVDEDIRGSCEKSWILRGSTVDHLHVHQQQVGR